MIALLRVTSCFIIVSVLAACSSGGPQNASTFLPTISSQNVGAASSRAPKAVNTFLVINGAGAFTNSSPTGGPCFGNPSGAIDILSFGFGVGRASAVGPTTTCNNAPGGFTLTGPSTTQAPVAGLAPANCAPNGVNQNGEVVGQNTFIDKGFDILLLKPWAKKHSSKPQCTPLPLLPGDTNSNAYAVNDAGTVVGWSGCKCGRIKHPVAWIDNKIVPLSMGFGEAVGINQRGTIIGTVFDSKGNPTAAIWEPTGIDTGQYILNLIGNLVPGAHLFGGQINDRGDATMYGTDAQGQPVAYYYDAPTNTVTQISVAGQQRALTPVGIDNTNAIFAIEQLVSTKATRHAASTQSRLVMIKNGTTTDLQTLVPPNVTLRPEDIKTGAGGSGFAVSPGTGVLVTTAQERIAGRSGPRTSAVETFTVYLIPRGCVPPDYRNRI